MIITRSPPARASPPATTETAPLGADAQGTLAARPVARLSGAASERDAAATAAAGAAAAPSSPLLEPQRLPTITPADLNDVKRQLSQALAKDAHTQASLVELEQERAKLRGQVAEAELQLVQARQETDAIREREVIRDRELARHHASDTAAREAAAANALAEQNRQHRANIAHREASEAWTGILDTWTERTGKRAFQIEAICQRKDRIMAEDAAFEGSRRLEHVERQLDQLRSQLDHAQSRVSKHRQSAYDAAEKLQELVEQLDDSRQAHRYAMDAVQEAKSEASHWRSKYQTLKDNSIEPPRPARRPPSPPRIPTPPPAVDIHSTSSDVDDRAPPPKKAKARSEKARHSPIEPPRGIGAEAKTQKKRGALEGAGDARKKEEKRKKAAELPGADDDGHRTVVPARAAIAPDQVATPVAIETRAVEKPVEQHREATDHDIPAKQPAPSRPSPDLPTAGEPPVKRKIKLHGKKRLDAWDGNGNLNSIIPSALTPIKGSLVKTGMKSILARRNPV